MTSIQQQAALRASFWGLVIPAAMVMVITTGTRQSMGLFLSPINSETGLGIVAISFAVAIGQFVWGAVQPITGAIADRYGPGRVIVAGGILLALGTALIPQMHSQAGLIVAIGFLSAMGAGAGSFSVLIGAAAQRLQPERRSFAAGLINAGGSLGQFMLAPMAQMIMSLSNWKVAMYCLALIGLLSIPMAWPLRRRKQALAPVANAATTGSAAELTLKQQLRIALKDKNYLLLHAGFFTCGFHISFLITHLPQEIALCGLPASVSAATLALIGLANIAGSLGAGALGNVYRLKYLLFWMYAARAVIVLVYMMAPKTSMTFYVFAFALGLFRPTRRNFKFKIAG